MTDEFAWLLVIILANFAFWGWFNFAMEARKAATRRRRTLRAQSNDSVQEVKL